MKHKPIQIDPELAAKCDQPDQFERFDDAFRGAITADPSEVQEAEKKAKASRKKP